MQNQNDEIPTLQVDRHGDDIVVLSAPKGGGHPYDQLVISEAARSDRSLEIRIQTTRTRRVLVIEIVNSSEIIVRSEERSEEEYDAD